MNIITAVRTLISYILISILLLVLGGPLLVMLCLPEKYRYDNKFIYFLFSLIYRGTINALFLPLDIAGINNISVESREPVIFVANHQSSLDIPVMGLLCKTYPHIWLVLAHYIKIPILGFVIKRMFIPIDRQTPEKAFRSLMHVIKAVKKNQRDLVIFPEGGRFIDGKIHDFFEGFAMIAKKTGHKIVPVYMQNNGKIYPPGSFLVHYYPIKVSIGEPFIFEEHETYEGFALRVKQWFEEQTIFNK